MKDSLIKYKIKLQKFLGYVIEITLNLHSHAHTFSELLMRLL